MSENLIAIVNRTGFPLQSALEAIAQQKQDTHYWYFLSREHSWQHPKTGETRFVDLILGGQAVTRSNAVVGIRAVIECKRLDGSMVFLIPSARNPDSSFLIRAYSTKRNETPECAWRDMQFAPSMHAIEFCASGIRKGARADQPDHRTLESWCNELLAASIAIAGQELSGFRKERDVVLGAVYFPILVTTANLYTLRFDPKAVTLDAGTVPVPPDSEVNRIDWVHFRKDFGVEEFGTDHLHPGKTDLPLKQSVFIVQANAFEEFLLKATLRQGPF